MMPTTLCIEVNLKSTIFNLQLLDSLPSELTVIEFIYLGYVSVKCWFSNQKYVFLRIKINYYLFFISDLSMSGDTSLS